MAISSPCLWQCSTMILLLATHPQAQLILLGLSANIVMELFSTFVCRLLVCICSFSKNRKGLEVCRGKSL